MRLASAGSGSKGNATLLRCGKQTLLIDCGYTLNQLQQRLQNLECSVEEISAILVTHEHSDHGSGVARLSQKYQIPVWTSTGTARALGLEHFNNLCADQSIELDGFRIDAVTVPHDAAEPVQFVFTDLAEQRRVGILTDCGSVTGHMLDVYAGVNSLLLEFNYDPEMLQNGPYPEMLKRRIAGNHGHLSNHQSCSFLSRLDTSNLQCLIAGHLSEKNNSADEVNQCLNSLSLGCHSLIADQYQGFDWIEV